MSARLKMRMASLLDETAMWVGSWAGPRKRMSVTSSLLPISCLLSSILPACKSCHSSARKHQAHNWLTTSSNGGQSRLMSWWAYHKRDRSKLRFNIPNCLQGSGNICKIASPRALSNFRGPLDQDKPNLWPNLWCLMLHLRLEEVQVAVSRCSQQACTARQQCQLHIVGSLHPAHPLLLIQALSCCC